MSNILQCVHTWSGLQIFKIITTFDYIGAGSTFYPLQLEFIFYSTSLLLFFMIFSLSSSLHYHPLLTCLLSPFFQLITVNTINEGGGKYRYPNKPSDDQCNRVHVIEGSGAILK